ncbi:hypothetical protein EVAR_4529_1 [Eumeta japonica]|uniref:Uncharacterized protein n=1 Tax=Eumeta variegata TaxID=151549 RepID=A0A4C1SW20_EUMVA|nr:hypothetical protein EVAR_4529_1 [Eumeta japonica]
MLMRNPRDTSEGETHQTTRVEYIGDIKAYLKLMILELGFDNNNAHVLTNNHLAVLMQRARVVHRRSVNTGSRRAALGRIVYGHAGRPPRLDTPATRGFGAELRHRRRASLDQLDKAKPHFIIGRNIILQYIVVPGQLGFPRRLSTSSWEYSTPHGESFTR